MSGCICHFCGYEIKDAAARNSIKALEDNFDTALQEQQAQLNTTLQEADAFLQSMKSSILSVESWDSAIVGDTTIEHEFNGTIVAVFVSEVYEAKNTMLCGIWTPATSGITNNLYGIINENADTYAVNVTISNNKVAITREGYSDMHVYVTALVVGGT